MAGQTDKQYTGQQVETGDSALGLYNYDARFYSTVLGRFLGVDPVAGAKGDLQSWNAYTYAGNSPLVYIDPTGTFSIDPRDWTSTAADAVRGIGSNLYGAYEAVSSTPGAVWDPVTQGLDMGMTAARSTGSAVAHTAVACWGNELCQGAVIGAGVMGCAIAAGPDGAAACAYAGAAIASVDNAVPCARGSMSDCGAIAFEAGAAYLSAGGGRVVAHMLEGQVESGLRRRLARGLAEYELKGLTEKQGLRVLENSRLFGAFRGERIDTFAKQSLDEGFLLKRFVRVPARFEFGPDFQSRLTGRWYDITTTQTEMDKKIGKYEFQFGADAVGLFY